MALKCFLFLPSACTLWGASPAYSQSFAGKAVNMIVGYSAGGGYGTYSRAIARHMGTYAHSKPAMVVHNMPGAESAKAAAYIYTIAPEDGTAIGAASPGAIIAPLERSQRPRKRCLATIVESSSALFSITREATA